MDVKKIPVIIISYNRLSHVRNMVNWMLEIRQQNIIILDNDSSYFPLLDWYKQIVQDKRVRVLKSDRNYGHRAIVNTELLKYLENSWFVYTDPDLIPFDSTPDDIIEKCYQISEKYKCNKVGPSLDIENIPDYYPLKQAVIDHESNFWKEENRTEEGDYWAPIDTTFALYRPGTTEIHAENCIRLNSPYKLQHLGWYYNPNISSQEEDYYYNDIVPESTHWSINNKYLRKF